MKLYKVFTNDRGAHRGVPMYSCFRDVRATSKTEAIKGAPRGAKAIKWPPADPDVKWLKRHV